MKKSFLFTLSLFATSLTFAQASSKDLKDEKSPEDRAKFLTEKMAAELQLTAAQKEQVYTINLGIAQKNQGILNSDFSEEQKKEIIRSNQEARIEMLKNVLTAAQFEELKKELKEQRQERIEQGGKEHHEKH
jgi:Spy/CpxP family protein refolding chaperone